jgi:ubiquinone/menaquinone biosynthesis C-methylase UbiE/DNA-binding MarR family transcriptional regulator
MPGAIGDEGEAWLKRARSGHTLCCDRTMIQRATVGVEHVFKALADDVRKSAYVLLCRHELQVGELVEVLRLPQSTVSRQLKVLRDAGLIEDQRDGNHVRYRAVRLGSEVAADAASATTVGNVDNASTADGMTADLVLRHHLLEWATQQELLVDVIERLEVVLERRRARSRAFFDRVGRHWDKLREEAFGAQFHLEALLALLPRAWRVADLGTGTGYLLPALATRFDQVVAVEPVERMRQAAEQRVTIHALENVDLRPGELAELPMTDGEVDLAIAILVLHHVPEPAVALAEVLRVLRPGGHLLIVEQGKHHHEGFRERMQDERWGFEPRELADHLRSAGFESVSPQRLATVTQAADAPALFAVTARKATEGER